MKNLKVKALAILAAWVGCVLAGIAVCQLLAHYFGTELVMNLIAGTFILWLVYGVYSAILWKLQWDDKVDELNQKR